MNFPSRKIIEELQQQYPVGSRVELIKMDDVQAPPIGTLGTVTGVDDAGSIMVHWDNGSGLSVAYGEDICRLVKKYWVSVAIDGRFHCEVEAASPDTAKEKAISAYQDADFGVLECIDAKPLNAESEDGEFVDL